MMVVIQIINNGMINKSTIIEIKEFPDSFNDRTITYYIDKIIVDGKTSLAAYMSADYKSFPTPTIIEWLVQKIEFKYVVFVPTGGDDNDWLFTSFPVDTDNILKVSSLILNKVFGN